MNAAAAFSNRQELLLAQLEQAENMEQAMAACAMALEQTACELAQDEQDEYARQRQQAVMAVARRAPQLLRAVTARGELVMADAPEKKEQKGNALMRGARAVGAFVLAALAVHEMIDGDMLFAGLQLLGGMLVGVPAIAQGKGQMQARGVAAADAKAMVRALMQLCQAADICVSDLMLLERDAGTVRLSGTADDAMLDLLTALMEAKASGRDDLAMRSLSQAEQYLRMLGVEMIFYSADSAALFDTLPTMGEARTIRPALVREGVVLRRGVAALQMERSVGA